MHERYHASRTLWRTECGRWSLVRSPDASGWRLFSNALFVSGADAVRVTGILDDHHRWPTHIALMNDLSEACVTVGIEPPEESLNKTGGWWTVDGEVYLYRTELGWSAKVADHPESRDHGRDFYRCTHHPVGDGFSTRAAATRAARLAQAVMATMAR